MRDFLGSIVLVLLAFTLMIGLSLWTNHEDEQKRAECEQFGRVVDVNNSGGCRRQMWICEAAPTPVLIEKAK